MYLLFFLSSALSKRSLHSFVLQVHDHHQTNILEWYHIGKVKDGDDPTPCTNTHSITRARDDASIATMVWQPTYTPPHAIGSAPGNPSLRPSYRKTSPTLSVTGNDICSNMSAIYLSRARMYRPWINGKVERNEEIASLEGLKPSKTCCNNPEPASHTPTVPS
jgi:hypothetical protein